MEREYWFITFSAALSGGIIFGGRVFAEMGLSFYQFAILHGLFIFLLLPIVILKKECRLSRDMLRLFVIFGFLSSLTYFTEFLPVFLGVPVAVVVLLLYTQPMWTAVLGRALLNERITRHKAFAVLLVMLGVLLLINPFSTEGVGDPRGVILAILGGALMSSWIIMSRIAGIRKYNPLTTKFGYSLFMLVFLFVFYPVFAFLVKDPVMASLSFDVSLDVLVYLGIYSVLLVHLPIILYFQGMKKVSASTSGVMLLLEPVVAAILASLFLNQPVTLNMMAGGSLILISNYIVIRKSRKMEIVAEV